jgi:hypothetical protein
MSHHTTKFRWRCRKADAEHSSKTSAQRFATMAIMHEIISLRIVDVFAQQLGFDASGTISANERGRTAGESDAWCLAVFQVRAAADVHPEFWEMHPAADELVCCLRGAIGLCARATCSDRPDDFATLASGQAVIVPRGRWHRLVFHQPTELLAVTMRQGTEMDPVN